MGGYVFDEAGHETFVKRWRETLLPFKDRGIEFFHAGECYEEKGRFKLLNSNERDELFRCLITLIRQNAKLGVVCSLEEKAFATAIKRNKLRVYSGSQYTAWEQAALDADFIKSASYNSHAFESKRAQPAFQAADLFLWLWQRLQPLFDILNVRLLTWISATWRFPT
jgi:hypothetical protein